MTDDPVETVRRFNRFYTARIGALQHGILRSPFSLAEARVLFELATHDGRIARQLAAELRLDAGYLSRLLRRLAGRALIDAGRSDGDRRAKILSLSTAGMAAFKSLDAASRREVAAMLAALPDRSRAEVASTMRRLMRLLDAEERPEPLVLRQHRPGDLGWIVHRHGAVYAREYGWDERFEGLVAGIAAAFIERWQPARERCWVAERDGRILGSVMLVDGGDGAARLRLLLVEPEARGLGLGRRLTDECIGFAHSVGYARITLWTQSILSAARRVYEAAGFTLIATEPHRAFGVELVGETWECALTPPPASAA